MGFYKRPTFDNKWLKILDFSDFSGMTRKFPNNIRKFFEEIQEKIFY